jgi:hypothetical protein
VSADEADVESSNNCYQTFSCVEWYLISLNTTKELL